jgi:hypothetical protein
VAKIIVDFRGMICCLHTSISKLNSNGARGDQCLFQLATWLSIFQFDDKSLTRATAFRELRLGPPPSLRRARTRIPNSEADRIIRRPKFSDSYRSGSFPLITDNLPDGEEKECWQSKGTVNAIHHPSTIKTWTHRKVS